MFVFTLLSILISIFSYPFLPSQIPIHWNSSGVVDGYGSRLFALGLFALIQLFMWGLYLILPQIDPRRDNYEDFKVWYDRFFSLMGWFFLVVQLFTIGWSLGVEVSPNILFPILIGALFLFLGKMLPRISQNYFVGIKTPWTLSDESNWDKTHSLGGKMFTILGWVSIASVILGELMFFVIIPLVLVSIVLLFVYSYLEYKKSNSQK